MEDQLRQIKWILAGLLVCAVVALAWATPLLGGLVVLGAAALYWSPALLLFLVCGFLTYGVWLLLRQALRRLRFHASWWFGRG